MKGSSFRASTETRSVLPLTPADDPNGAVGSGVDEANYSCFLTSRKGQPSGPGADREEEAEAALSTADGRNQYFMKNGRSQAELRDGCASPVGVLSIKAYPTFCFLIAPEDISSFFSLNPSVAVEPFSERIDSNRNQKEEPDDEESIPVA